VVLPGPWRSRANASSQERGTTPVREAPAALSEPERLRAWLLSLGLAELFGTFAENEFELATLESDKGALSEELLEEIAINDSEQRATLIKGSKALYKRYRREGLHFMDAVVA